MPTERAPTGSNRKSAPSSAGPDCARATLVMPAPAASTAANTTALERCRLIREHDGDVVAHRVSKAARVANERRLFGPILELALALGANENREQLRRKCHRAGS